MSNGSVPFTFNTSLGNKSINSAGLIRVTLPSPKQIKEEFPLCKDSAKLVAASRNRISDIISGHSKQLICLVGPCSVHDTESVIDYAEKLCGIRKRLQENDINTDLVNDNSKTSYSVSSNNIVNHNGHGTAINGHMKGDPLSGNILIVMRVYCEKARTGLGWKGLSRDPFLDGSNDICAGIRKSRELIVTLLNRFRMPCAVEFLDPLFPQYIGDLVSWAAVGARTAESQIHRELASSLYGIPVGFKNSTSGSITAAIESIAVCQEPHTFLSIDDEGNVAACLSRGNPLGHLVLRGGRATGPNYKKEFVKDAVEAIKNRFWSNSVDKKAKSGADSRSQEADDSEAPFDLATYQHFPSIIVDFSHDNCAGNFKLQSVVAEDFAIQLESKDSMTADYLSGFMIESFIKEGKQTLAYPSGHSKTVHTCGLLPSQLEHGVSITDGCIGIDETERVLRRISEAAKVRFEN
eukprot:Tbor_TRINITY_DN6789_c0_g1::TRINITY_DN6789_c0_g1_i1::g.15302::m.15302/K01626/E2.5.1.54, aroF, aroG, aroH; 3-deoxy-7-phosphoheptulonate synthase